MLDFGWDTLRVMLSRGILDLVMISSLFVGWSRWIDGGWGAGWRFRIRHYGRRWPLDCFYVDDFGAGLGFGPGFGTLDGGCANQSHGAAVEFLAGVFGGAFKANFVAVEVGQDAFRAGVHPVDEGEAAVVVALDIVQPATQFELFVADGVEGGFDTVQPQQAPIGHGDLADQEFRTGGGGLVLGAVGFEQGFKLGGIFAGHDDGFGAQAVFEAVQTDGGAAFGRRRARGVGFSARRAVLRGDRKISASGDVRDADSAERCCREQATAEPDARSDRDALRFPANYDGATRRCV